jgi:hypothetical protein
MFIKYDQMLGDNLMGVVMMKNELHDHHVQLKVVDAI